MSGWTCGRTRSGIELELCYAVQAGEARQSRRRGPEAVRRVSPPFTADPLTPSSCAGGGSLLSDRRRRPVPAAGVPPPPLPLGVPSPPVRPDSARRVASPRRHMPFGGLRADAKQLAQKLAGKGGQVAPSRSPRSRRITARSSPFLSARSTEWLVAPIRDSREGSPRHAKESKVRRDRGGGCTRDARGRGQPR